MYKKLSVILLICFAFNISVSNVFAAEKLVWYGMETTETKKDVSSKNVTSNSQSTNKKNNPIDTKTSVVTANEVKNEDVAAAIEVIQKKRKEEDEILKQLLIKQQELQKIKAEEAKKAEDERKAKEDEQKRLIAELTAKQELQKKEVKSAIEELKKQNAEQQNQQAKIIGDLLEQLRIKQVAEQNSQSAQPPAEPTTASPTLTATVKDNIQEQIYNSTQDGSLAPSTEADISFKYSAGSLFRIHTKMGYLTDVQLQTGEEIVYVGGGDSSRWLIEKAQSGSADGQVWHLYIKPTAVNADTNIVMTTTKRSYQLLVMADNWYNPIVKWTYPEDVKKVVNNTNDDVTINRNTMIPQNSEPNFEYEIVGKNYAWAPKTVWDDGRKTYIKMSGSMAVNDAPVLFIRNANGLVMVNYRLQNGCFVVDRLFNKAELRNGKEVIKIRRSKSGG